MMKKALNENILGLFPDKSRIQQCVARLRSFDFSASNISVEIAKSENIDPNITIFGLEKRTKAAESAFVTGFIGAGLGATLGALFNVQLAMELYMSVMIGIFFGAVLGIVVGMKVGHLVQEHDESEPARQLKTM